MKKTKKEVVCLIRKLFNLSSENTSEFEGDLALKKAKNLLAEHNLSLVDITDTEKTSIGSDAKYTLSGKRIARWKKLLCVIIVEYLDVDYFYVNMGPVSIFTFFGITDNVETCKIVFPSLISQITELSKKYDGKKSDYRSGLLYGLRKKLAEIRLYENSNSTALAVVGKEISDRWLESREIDIKVVTSKKSTIKDTRSYYSGLKDSASLSLGKCLDCGFKNKER